MAKIIDIIETKAKTYNDACDFLESVARDRGYLKSEFILKFEKIVDREGNPKKGYARLLISK